MLLLAVALGGGEEARAETSIRLGAVLDGRLARTGDTLGWRELGPGRLRWGADEDGSARTLGQLGQASLLLDARAGETLALHVQANLDLDREEAAGRRTVASLVEAFGSWRWEPNPWLRVRTRGGLFFPPLSLEHTGPAWTPVSTLTPSAINAWVGEEIRATGAEARLAALVRDHELWAVGGVFGWNDPAGSLLVWRGWAVHDLQTKVGDRLPLPVLSSLAPGGLFENQAPWVEPIQEIDDRAGYYAGGGWRAGTAFRLEALRWDNRGSPTSFDGRQYAWATAFTSAGARVAAGPLEVLAQGLDGRTRMGPVMGHTTAVDARFRAAYALASVVGGRHRLSARYDRFRVRDDDIFQVEDDNTDDGEAWTAAYVLRLARHQVALEWVRSEASRAGAPVRREDVVQASVRLVF